MLVLFSLSSKNITDIIFVNYWVTMPGQQDTQPAFCILFWHFNMENEASLREPPTLDVAVKLIENFKVDGFVSVGEPVLIRSPAWC